MVRPKKKRSQPAAHLTSYAFIADKLHKNPYIARYTLLQRDIDNLFSWSTSSNLHFNSSKSCHLSFNRKFPTSYTISGNIIITKQSHKDLGVTLSDNLEWKTHHDIILSKAYKTLGLVRRTFSSSIPPLTKVKLYVSLIRSQLMYCSPIWRPYLVKESVT